jgi:hypothetical protein
LKVLPFDIICRKLPDFYEGSEVVMVPLDLLKLLLIGTLHSETLDEGAYLSANPDVESAIRRGEVDSAKTHFLRYGYFENRAGFAEEFDEEYYLERNPDVALAVEEGVWTDGRSHYAVEGRFEWRSPCAGREEVVRQWRSLLEAPPMISRSDRNR